METLVVIVAKQKKQCCSITRSQQGLVRFNTAPSKNLREVKCRYAEGILHRYSEGILHRATIIQQPSTPTSPSSNLASPKSGVLSPFSKHSPKSSPISIAVKPFYEKSLDTDFSDDILSFSERWAGPTYSNSPPPSSLPMPKFLQQLPKRTLSLDFPTVHTDDVTLHPISKSAPASPTGRECGNRDLFSSADSATKALRQILNLDLDDE